MSDEDKTRQQLVAELGALRRRVAELEATASDKAQERVMERTAGRTRASEDLAIFRKFAETSSQGFSMADLDGHITYVNPALGRILGEEPPENAIGKHLSSYFSEETNRKGKQEIEPALYREGYWAGELPMRSRRGTWIATWHNTFLIRNESGRPLRLAVAITDVTERKKAEEALRQTCDELTALYDGMLDGLVIFNIETMRVVRANLAFLKIFGYSQEELGLVSPGQMHRTEDFARIQEQFQAVVEGRASYYEAMPMLTKRRKLLYVDVASSRITYGGRPCIISFFHDVTDRRRAQKALQKERRTLAHMLRASDHERQLIAYDIHDGLAQELAGAIMQFQAYDHLRATNPGEAQKVFDLGVTLLQRGHVEARRLISGVRPPILDESGVVAAVAHLVHDPDSPRPRIEFESRVGFKRLAPVLENTIYRIVQEGLTNARNHSGSEEVRIGLIQRGDRLRIEIRDWGVGFDPKTVQENRFGLEGIRERARLLGGKCRIKSKLGEGTAILVELPVVEREWERS